MAISGGNDWMALAEPVKAAGEYYFVLFMFFIAFIIVALLNILTGIFVEQCVEAAMGDRDNVVIESAKKNDAFAASVMSIFEDIDDDGSGMISWPEFKSGMENPRMQAYLEAIQIDAKDAAMFFNLVCGKSLNGSVDAHKFLSACQRLKGPATMMDMQSLAYQVQEVLQANQHLVEFCEKQFRHLARLYPGTPTEKVVQPRRSAENGHMEFAL